MLTPRPLVRLWPLATASAAAILFCAVSALGGGPRQDTCESAYSSAQEHVKTGHLREARERLLACAKAVCGPSLKQRCTSEFVQLNASDIPSIVPHATDGAGRPLVEVEVAMDGEVLTLRLDGQPLSVDPGFHEFSFATTSGLYAVQKILIAQGERNLPLSLSLRPGARPQTRVASMPAAPVPSEAAKAAPAQPLRGASSPVQDATTTASGPAERREKAGVRPVVIARHGKS